ncbi:MAG TPA: hypothetical protein DD738_06370 [Ruminiclostridium sp.]|nr:hypothetical protein [Ruminiclostridium sp.]
MNTGEKPGKILIILNRVPVFLLSAFLVCILSASLFIRAEFCWYRHGDNPAWIDQDIFFLVLTAFLLLCVFFLVYKLGERLEKYNRKQVILAVLYSSAVLQLFYILLLPAKQFADQETVNLLAVKLIKGGYAAFNRGGYLYQYPNNVGITLFLSMMYKIFPHTLLVPKLINVAFSTATAFFIFRIYEELCRPKAGKAYGILIFSGVYPPMILLNNLAYNDVYATALFAGFVYCSIRYLKTKKAVHLVPAGLFVTAGNFLRQLGVIFLLAVTLYFIIQRVNLIKILAFFAAMLFMLNLPLSIVNAYFLHTNKISEPVGKNSIPIHMWIHIGMNEEKMGYWDNSRSYNVYTHQGQWNKAISAKFYSEMIRRNIKEKGPKRIASVYLKKNIWLWSEGTYQAEYYGIGSRGYLYSTFATRYVQYNTGLRDAVRWVLHVTNLLMLSLICVGLFHSIFKKYSYALIFPAIILLGFIGFYTLWEIKPRYIYPIYPYLILMSYHGLRIFAGKAGNRRTQNDIDNS